MPKFEKQFVYFMWDSELVGKECFVADDIDSLMSAFNAGAMRTHEIIDKNDEAFPFVIREGGYYRFAYYDPHYDFKKAREEGKQIQYELDGKWFDLDSADEPGWDSGYSFRIKPEEPEPVRMTHRQLAEWLAKGNGQVSYVDRCVTTDACLETVNSYFESKDTAEVPYTCKIRRWGSDEWIEPTADVYEADCKKDDAEEKVCSTCRYCFSKDVDTEEPCMSCHLQSHWEKRK